MATDLGEQFARAIAAQDPDALKKLMAPKMSFSALTPGRCWESDDADSVVDDVILGSWFSPECSITRVLEVHCATVGEVDRVGYRFQVTRPDGGSVIDQQAYLRSEHDQISWLRMLCSGFLHVA
jgi:hypothetical protein